MTTSSIYAEHAPKALALGYSPIPIVDGEKRPAISRWQRHCDEIPTAQDLLRYSEISKAGLGIALGNRLGAFQIVAIDLDVEGDDLDKLSSALPASPMEKRGAKGLTRYYRADVSLKTKHYRADNGRGLADVQAHGAQTVLPPSHHPSGVDYAWTAGPVSANELPIFELTDLERFEDGAASLGWGGREDTSIEACEHGALGVKMSDEDDICPRLNARALSNLDWVRLLNLTGYRPTSNGAEAVAHWRPSGTSNVLERRKPSLKFHSTGIRDMGTGVGYSAIDVVMKAQSLSQDDAFGWLSEATGMTAEINEGVDWDQLLPNFLAKREAEHRQKANEFVEAYDGTLADATIGEIIPPRTSLHGLAATWDDREGNGALNFEWLVKGMFPRRGVSLLWGQSGSGKSFVSLELAACIATGKPFFGNRTKATGGVLFALGEGTGSMPIRLNALRMEGFPLPAPLNPATGQLLDLDHLPFVWVSVDNLSKPGPFAIFANAVRREAGEMESRHGCALRLIIVDTVVAAFGFEDDPDATKVTIAMRALDGLAQELGLLVVAVHHAGKSKAAGEHGSYAWRGSAETSIEVDAERDSVGVVKERRVWVRKNRHGAEGFNRPFELRSVSLGYDEDGDEVSSAIVVPFEPEAEVVMTSGGTPAVGARRVLDALGAASKQAETIATEDGRQVEAIRRVDVRAVYAPNHPGKPDTVDRNFSRDLDRAIDLGLVEKGTARNAVWLWLLASNDNGIALKYASDA